MFRARAGPERLTAFCDGVFAVLITVLVLDLRPPVAPTFSALLSLWPTCLFAVAVAAALRYPIVGLAICCCCLIVHLMPEAPGT